MNNIFRFRAYGKSELARLYYPDISDSQARRNFNRELQACRALWMTLRRQGLTPKSRMFNPRQVRTVAAYLGEP